MRLLLLLLVLAQLCNANNWYRASIAVQTGSHTADILSSIGGYERNRFLRGPDGRFSLARGIAVKSAWMAGMIALGQTAWGKRHRRLLTAMNFGQAAIVGTVAARNYRIR